MDFTSSSKISAAALTANRTWMNVLASNLANANTTRTQSGKPYERRTIIYESVPAAESFSDNLEAAMDEGVSSVRVSNILPDGRDFKQIYDPNHPDANAQGVVETPNINPIEEMANIMIASRAFEANLAVLNTAKQMALKAIEIGK